jgi:hypothetical protein
MDNKESICLPAILYLGISLVETIVNLYHNKYNTALLKIAASSFIGLIINFLCNRDYNIVSWIITLLLTIDIPINIIKNKISSFKL